MSLIDELKEMRAKAVAKCDEMHFEAMKFERLASQFAARVDELDKAISALTPEDGKGLDARFDNQQQVPDDLSPQASETDATKEIGFVIAQPQTKSEQSEIHHPDAQYWTKALEQDRKPQPGFIEGAVSKLFGIDPKKETQDA